VNSDEVGVVRRFGRVLPDDLEPGLHWRWPWPIEEVSRVRPHRLRAVEVGFRSVSGRSESGIWASPHGEGIRRYPDEAVMITGDENLIEVLATIHYTIDDVRVYLFEGSQPEETLRYATEAVLREVVAGRDFTALLTHERLPVQMLVLDRLRVRCQGLGLKLESVTLQELHPPPEVVPYFHEVAQATEEEQRLINAAREAEINRRASASADETRLDEQGKAERHAIRKDAEANRDAFLARWKVRSNPGLLQEVRLIVETLRRTKRGQTQDEINALYARLRREELTRQAQWSDERLRREVLARTLPGRDLVLIDAPPAMASLLYTLEHLRELFPQLFSRRSGEP
jgi:Cu+-exporting ATPase